MHGLKSGTNKKDFEMKAAALLEASTKAGKAAGDKAALGAVFNEVGNTCKACHQKIQSKKTGIDRSQQGHWYNCARAPFRKS